METVEFANPYRDELGKFASAGTGKHKDVIAKEESAHALADRIAAGGTASKDEVTQARDTLQAKVEGNRTRETNLSLKKPSDRDENHAKRVSTLASERQRAEGHIATLSKQLSPPDAGPKQPETPPATGPKPPGTTPRPDYLKDLADRAARGTAGLTKVADTLAKVPPAAPTERATLRKAESAAMDHMEASNDFLTKRYGKVGATAVNALATTLAVGGLLATTPATYYYMAHGGDRGLEDIFQTYKAIGQVPGILLAEATLQVARGTKLAGSLVASGFSKAASGARAAWDKITGRSSSSTFSDDITDDDDYTSITPEETQAEAEKLVRSLFAIVQDAMPMSDDRRKQLLASSSLGNQVLRKST